MSEYLRQVRGFRPDVKLFLFYNLLAFVGWGVFQLIFNLYVAQLGLREDDMGAFSAVQTMTMAAGAVTMGPFIGRFGIWRCMVGGVSIFLAASYGMAFAENRTLLLALSVVLGIGLAYLFTATMPFIIEWTRPQERQTVAAVAFAVIGLSGTLGSLLGGLMPGLLTASPLVAYRLALVAGTAITTVGLVPLLLMGPARQRHAPADPAARTEPEGRAERRRVRQDVAMFVLIGGLMALGAGAVIPFYNVYLTTLGASAEQVGFVFALAGLGAATIGLAAPAVSRRFGSLWGAVVVRLAGLPLYALLLVWPSLPVAILAHVVRQTTISMAWPIDSTFIADLLPPRARSSVFGYRSGAWNIGYSAASLVGGVTIVQSGYRATFLALIAFTALSMAIFGAYYARHLRIRAGELPNALPQRRRLERERRAQEEKEAEIDLLPSASEPCPGDGHKGSGGPPRADETTPAPAG